MTSQLSVSKKIEIQNFKANLRFEKELLNLRQANERLQLEKANIEAELVRREEVLHRLSHRDAIALVENDKLRQYYLKVSKVLLSKCQETFYWLLGWLRDDLAVVARGRHLGNTVDREATILAMFIETLNRGDQGFVVSISLT